MTVQSSGNAGAAVPRGGGGTTTRMVTYQVKEGRADENAAYVRDVMADLAARGAEGVTYSVYLLDDGVTFLHVAEEQGESGALQVSEAFQRFTETLLEDRCAATPELQRLTVVGRYTG